MLELSPSDPIIKIYLKDLQHLKSQQVTHELGLKGPFQKRSRRAPFIVSMSPPDYPSAWLRPRSAASVSPGKIIVAPPPPARPTSE